MVQSRRSQHHRQEQLSDDSTALTAEVYGSVLTAVASMKRKDNGLIERGQRQAALLCLTLHSYP